jgi:hypothetical protein
LNLLANTQVDLLSLNRKTSADFPNDPELSREVNPIYAEDDGLKAMLTELVYQFGSPWLKDWFSTRGKLQKTSRRGASASAAATKYSDVPREVKPRPAALSILMELDLVMADFKNLYDLGVTLADFHRKNDLPAPVRKFDFRAATQDLRVLEDSVTGVSKERQDDTPGPCSETLNTPPRDSLCCCVSCSFVDDPRRRPGSTGRHIAGEVRAGTGV